MRILSALLATLLVALLAALLVPSYAWSDSPLPSPVQGWLKANNTSSDEARDALIDEAVASDFTSLRMDGVVLGNRESLKAFLFGAHRALGNYELHVKDSAVDQDKVWLRLAATGVHTGPLLGYEPTGRSVSVGLVVILRIAGNKVVQEWQLSDAAALERQLSGVSNSEVRE